MIKTKLTLAIAVAVIGIGLLIVFSIFVKVKTVSGDEMAVLETWEGGVIEQALPPKTYVKFPGFLYTFYTYKVSTQVFVMNDKAENEEFGEGRKADAYIVQSKEGQDMKISLNVQWSRDPSKVVELHKSVRDNLEEKLLRSEVMAAVKNEATTRSALDAYSGEGLVKLQADIFSRLRDPNGELWKRGVRVHNFVIEHIALDPKYVNEIKDRQVAVQERLKNIEQTKAAEAEAQKAKAQAQANYERTLVEAKRDKDVGVLNAEKEAEQQILAANAQAKQVALAAEAEKNKNVLLALGEKEAALNRAQAIEALGKAEAEAMRQKLSAYSAQGASGYVQIEVAKSMAEAFKGIQGYLPEGMSINLLSEQYSKGVNLLVNPQNNR